MRRWVARPTLVVSASESPMPHPKHPGRPQRVVTITTQTTAAEAASQMRERGIGAVVVVDDAGRPLSIVTDRDLALRVLREGLDPARVPAHVPGGPPPVTGEVGADPFEEARRMRAQGVRRLPLLDAEGAVVDIVTTDDLLCRFAGELHRLAEAVCRGLDNESLRDEPGLSRFGKE